MKIVAVTNRKGGVGKSTMTTHIAQVLAGLGYRVGIVDTDSQGHSALLLDMVANDPLIDNGLHRALIEGVPLEQAVLEVPIDRFALPPNGMEHTPGALYLLPSSDRTYRIPFEINQGQIFALMELIEAMGALHDLDIVLIDTNPTLNLFDAWVFMAADAYLYVTECERMAFDGISTATTQINNVRGTRKRYLNRESELLGIIPNKFRASTFIHKQNIAFLEETFPGKVWTPVNLRTAWVDASEMHQPIYRFAPRDQGARDIYRIAHNVQEALGWLQPVTATN